MIGGLSPAAAAAAAIMMSSQILMTFSTSFTDCWVMDRFELLTVVALVSKLYWNVVYMVTNSQITSRLQFRLGYAGSA